MDKPDRYAVVVVSRDSGLSRTAFVTHDAELAHESAGRTEDDNFRAVVVGL